MRASPQNRWTGAHDCTFGVGELPCHARAVQLRWSELAETHRPGEWQGLSLTVLGAPAPGLTVSVCAPRRIRLAVKERPLLWARIDDFYSGYELLRSSEAISPGVIPPIPFALAEQHRHAGDRPGFDRAWARAFAEMLARSNACPLSDGPWRLGSTQAAILRQVTLALEAADRARTTGMEERLARAQRLMTVEGANRLLLDAFVPTQHAGPTRAAVLAGGVDQWTREVTEQLAQQQIAESELLNGLSG